MLPISVQKIETSVKHEEKELFKKKLVYANLHINRSLLSVIPILGALQTVLTSGRQDGRGRLGLR